MSSTDTVRRFFSVRIKLLLLLACLIFFFLAAVAASLVGLYRINQSSSVIIDREAPFVRSTEEALFAMVQAQSAAERLLDLDDPAQEEEAKRLRETFDSANARFEMFMAAITWGSETDAFKQAQNGKHYQGWVDAGLTGVLTVQESSTEQAENAGRIDIYYGGYTGNIQKAIEERERYIASRATNPKAAEEARALSKEFQVKARRFADLTAEHLQDMIELSSETTAASATSLRETEDNVRGITIIVSVIGFLISIAIGISFAEKIIVEPLFALTKAAREFGAGRFSERITIRSQDELGVLGNAFNDMAGKLAAYTANLEKEVAERTAELKEKVQELDVSNRELSEREQELQNANDRLRELDKVKSEFISVAAHQLRTPLSALKWILGLLIDENSENLSAEQKSLLLKGFESNERMINLINEMLVVTRLESGKVQYAFAPIHIEDLIDNTILDFAVQAHVRKINLSFQRPRERMPFITADPEKIRNVIQNLIENSMRYTNDGGTITLGTNADDKMVTVSVADNGIGIPEKQQPSIFNKFFRADNAVKKQTDGSGLGLFIAKSIVEKHGGKIWFESAPGKGTTFFFTIPLSTDARAT